MKKSIFVAAVLAMSAVAPNLANAGVCGVGCVFTENVADFVTDPGPAPNPIASSFSAGLYHQTLYTSTSGVYRSPYENFTPPDSQGVGYGVNPYSSVQGGGWAAFNTGLANALSILWGSPDGYNTLEFWSGQNGTGTMLYSMTGSLLVQTYGHDLVSIATLQFFESVVLRSGTNAFEFAGLSASCSTCAPSVETPVPGALPLFASGLSMLGFYGWRRRRKSA